MIDSPQPDGLDTITSIHIVTPLTFYTRTNIKADENVIKLIQETGKA